MCHLLVALAIHGNSCLGLYDWLLYLLTLLKLLILLRHAGHVELLLLLWCCGRIRLGLLLLLLTKAEDHPVARGRGVADVRRLRACSQALCTCQLCFDFLHYWKVRPRSLIIRDFRLNCTQIEEIGTHFASTS